MNFENFLSQKIFELRHELNKMTNEHPELKPHFGLSHAGLLDNETEKLVESCSFFLTLTHSKMQSIIANQVRNFMEPIFPEWYIPEIPSYIVEFDNFEEFYSIQEEFDEKEYITCECQIDEQSLKLSTLGKQELSPFKAINSYFVAGDRECFLNIEFKNMLEFEDYDFNAKLRVYLQSDDPEEMVSLIGYLFDRDLFHKEIIFQNEEEEYKISKDILSLNFNFSEKKYIFFESKNKLENTRDILNNLKNMLYIDIDLSKFKILMINEFKLKIPLLGSGYSNFKNLRNFIKTNCFVFYNIYKQTLPWKILNSETEGEIEIADLKTNGVISVSDIKFIDNKTEKKIDPSSFGNISKYISFDFELPFNIEHKIKYNTFHIKNDIRFEQTAICTNLFINNEKLLQKNITVLNSLSTSFGKILNSSSDHIFYSEALSNPLFFQYLYNMNYFIGKKIKPLKLLIQYFKSLEHLFFNNKNLFYTYINNIMEQNWTLKVEVINTELDFYSDFLLTKMPDKKYFFYDRYMESLMTSINDKDYRHIIRRN
ncbi:hypothetical protein GCL60_06860 [Silvanigrella paludirubra]|uniref:Type VI secretion system baseplate subunit TssF n=1 Tax=Silvanigrella paludirubra TaxID=2499159 RepID=A0A6N6VX17_9BACT|nr:type VI secretion system baseplate subunit TssF [Silvanigrella paludirubra]KAB8039977.1 hypothetical protein GCL60_06860 [Silvanigrella paludirubra]